MSDKIPNLQNSSIIHNLDICVPNEILRQFPDLIPLFTYQEFIDEFGEPERSANLYKKLFNFAGLLSLVLIILVLLFTLWRFSALSAGFEVLPVFVWVSAVLGMLSFSIALTSYFFHFQDKWLTSRFTTERIRQFIFHSLLDGSFIELAKTDKDLFNENLQKRWQKFKLNFVYKNGAMDDFVKAEDLKLFVEPNLSRNNELNLQIFEAYFDLRLNYQANYFSYKQRDLIDIDEWTKSLAKFSLLIAGILALAEIIILLIHDAGLEKQLGWILGSLAVSAALVSAAVRVFRNARAISEETERYISKWVMIKILSERFTSKNLSPDKKLEVMVESERVFIEELREFIRAFNKSDYLL